MKKEKPKILFVCTMNKSRSLTADHIYQDDPRFEVRSAGTSITARKVITPENLKWADYIIVMEGFQRGWIREVFPEIYETKNISGLYIRDIYTYMDPELVELIKEKFEKVWYRIERINKIVEKESNIN